MYPVDLDQMILDYARLKGISKDEAILEDELSKFIFEQIKKNHFMRKVQEANFMSELNCLV